MKKKRILMPLLILVLVVALVGITGCAGEQGLKGNQGSMGIQGIQGEQGIHGEPGLQGEQGEPGARGAKGTAGTTGATGPIGAAGEQGEQGERGPSGFGSRGATGPAGPRYFTVALSAEDGASANKTVGTTVHLKSTGSTHGDEARISIYVPVPMTLGQLTSISWWENLSIGYPPHVDVLLDLDGDRLPDDTLVFEYAYNPMSHYAEPHSGGTAFGALTGSWYAVFSDDTLSPATITINDQSYAWLGSGPPGPPASHISGTLAQWKAGIGTVDANAAVIALEIEVDNWIVPTDVLVDCITINGTLVWVP